MPKRSELQGCGATKKSRCPLSRHYCQKVGQWAWLQCRSASAADSNADPANCDGRGASPSHAHGASYVHTNDRAATRNHATDGYTRHPRRPSCRPICYRTNPHLFAVHKKGMGHSDRNRRLWNMPRNRRLRSAQVPKVSFPNAVAGADKTSCTSANFFRPTRSIGPLWRYNGVVIVSISREARNPAFRRLSVARR
jgi:hypothetical protein